MKKAYSLLIKSVKIRMTEPGAFGVKRRELLIIYCIQNGIIFYSLITISLSHLTLTLTPIR